MRMTLGESLPRALPLPSVSWEVCVVTHRGLDRRAVEGRNAVRDYLVQDRRTWPRHWPRSAAALIASVARPACMSLRRNLGFSPPPNSASPQKTQTQECGAFTQHMRNQAAAQRSWLIRGGFTSRSQPSASRIVCDIAI
jgi:hypothetical protein